MTRLHDEVNQIVDRIDDENPLQRALRLTDQPALFTFCDHSGDHVIVCAENESVAWLRLSALLSIESTKRDWQLENVAVEGLDDEFGVSR